MLENYVKKLVAEGISKYGGLSCEGRGEFFSSVVIKELIKSLEELLLVGFSRFGD